MTKRKWNEKHLYNNKIAEGVKEILTLLNINLEDENFKDTPRRFTQVLEDFTYSLSEEGKKELEYLFTRKFKSDYNGMVISKDIVVYSLCPHHILPIRYKIHFSYIPDGYVLGLSKVIDIIKLLCAKPALQEDITMEIADKFYNELKAKGVMIIIDGDHSCMKIRDSEARETSTITSCVKGVFFKEGDTKFSAKDEFMGLIK